MAIPYTGQFTATSCNSWLSHGRYTWSHVNLNGGSLHVLIHSSFNKQWQPPLSDRPGAQHVQSTCRMRLRLTVKRP
jgi:hypothetical protein